MPISRFLLPLLLAKPLAAQPPIRPEALVGTWNLVHVDNVLADGTRVHLYGDRPDGVLTFDAQGRYAVQILSRGRPSFASGDKAKGTPEEQRAAVEGNNSHFGRYLVDPAGSAITFRIEHAFFPNWEGTEQRRKVRLRGDELTYTVPSPTTGGVVTGEVKWRRAR